MLKDVKKMGKRTNFSKFTAIFASFYAFFV